MTSEYDALDNIIQDAVPGLGSRKQDRKGRNVQEGGRRGAGGAGGVGAGAGSDGPFGNSHQTTGSYKSLCLQYELVTTANVGLPATPQEHRPSRLRPGSKHANNVLGQLLGQCLSTTIGRDSRQIERHRLWGGRCIHTRPSLEPGSTPACVPRNNSLFRGCNSFLSYAGNHTTRPSTQLADCHSNDAIL
ncbi:hypothetical protein LB505_005506 [Fusarium chuoi]|nr:hypothetical protein LB505_005506 [Fusarium chuoi]